MREDVLKKIKDLEHHVIMIQASINFLEENEEFVKNDLEDYNQEIKRIKAEIKHYRSLLKTQEEE